MRHSSPAILHCYKDSRLGLKFFEEPLSSPIATFPLTSIIFPRLRPLRPLSLVQYFKMDFFTLPWNRSYNSTLEFVSTLTLVLLVLYCLCVATFRLFFSPLRSIPGPWYAAVSDLWHLSHVLRLRRCRGIDELFNKYGPIVRVAPNIVAFLDVKAMKVVYGTNARLSKSSMYKSCMT